jgi:copper transport protein
MKTARRLVAVVALAGVAVFAGAGPASAHAELVSSDPANGATLETAPTEIRITFSEQPDPAVSGIFIYDSSGARLGDDIVGPPAAQGDRTLVFPITGELPKGVYTVSWTTTSVEDGHTTTNSFTFGVGVTPTGTSAAAPPPSTSGPTPLSVISKSLLYAGLMLLVAIAVVGMGVFGGAPTARPRVGMWAAAAALIGVLGFVWAQQRGTGASLSRYLGSEAARLPIMLAAVTLAAAILALVATRSSQRWLPWAAGAAAAIALALRAHGGHAAAAPLPLLAQTEQWVHMMAGACWAGGLILLVLLVRERRDDPPVALAHRYSTVALIAIAVVVASGALRGVAELGGLDDVVRIWQSTYGRTLAIKIAVVLGVIMLGAINRYRSLARLPHDHHPLLRVASAEIVAAVGILALTATLTSLPPPVSQVAAQAAPTDTVTMTGSDFATTVDGTVTVTPAQPGPNLYRATFTSFGTDQPFPADEVQLQLQSVTRPNVPGATVKFRADGDGWVAQALVPSIAGTFLATAQVRTGATVVQIPLTLITRSNGQITTTSAPDGETVAVASFTDGVRLQATSSASTPTQVHVTAYGADGNELRLGTLVIVGSPAGGRPTQLSVQRFTKGHFAASSELAPGDWTFDAIATTANGQAYQCTWQSTVPG